MRDFRGEMLARQISNLKRALASLAGVLRDRGADDPHAVRIHFTNPDGTEIYGSLCLGLLPLADLVDAVRQRSTDVARTQDLSCPVENSIHGLYLLTDIEKRTK